MQKYLSEIQEYVRTHRSEAAIIGGVLFIIVIASIFTIQASSKTNVSVSVTPTPLPTREPKKRPPDEVATPTEIPTLTPKTTNQNEEDETVQLIITTLPTTKPTATSTPTNTPVPQSATNTPTPTSTPIPTTTPDTTAPTMSEMTGPADGSTVNFKNFCFPMKPSDDRSTSSQIQTNYKFDSSDWSGWGNQYSPCYNDIANGSHTFSVQLKDEAGNVSSSINRTFTVNVE